jgi:hypothetical protein
MAGNQAVTYDRWPEKKVAYALLAHFWTFRIAVRLDGPVENRQAERERLCAHARHATAANGPPKKNYVTSDHRVAGSSPTGCKASTRADLRAIQDLEKRKQENLLANR